MRKAISRISFLVIIIMIIGLIYLLLGSCGTVGKHAVWVSGPGGGNTTAQPPLFAASSFKLTGPQPQPSEFSLGYYNNNFEPFNFINLNIQAGFSFFSVANLPDGFQNQTNSRKVIILGTGWISSPRELCWVGKIIENPPSVTVIQHQAQNYKTIEGRNFAAIYMQLQLNTNFEQNGLKFLKNNNQTPYNLIDFDNPKEDFRAVAFKVSGTSYAGSIVGRNVAFYSSSSTNFNTWQNAINDENINSTTTPREFIGFDVIHVSVNPISTILVGADISETRGELRGYIRGPGNLNQWMQNAIAMLEAYVGPNRYPLYSSDYVSSLSDPSRIQSAMVSGRRLLIFWNDDGDGLFEINNDTIIYHIFNQDENNNTVNLYGVSIFKDTNNNRFITVGYDEISQKGVIYTGIAQPNANQNIGQLANPPTPVNLSNLGLNLRDIIFFDVATVNQNVIVVGVDLSNCPIKPYTQQDLQNPQQIPKLTKSLIFPSYTRDQHIIQTFTNMKGIILFSNDNGQTFTNFSVLLR
ncbi:MAG: hypothetical protein RMJ51_04150 [Candidatus Calescibacterium sp.]|nr:hypothetical protein [Candidatus Calescibacterium sp.]MDW8195413.1 hypothetical protein [Candidatus Calescibacterium sp.]